MDSAAVLTALRTRLLDSGLSAAPASGHVFVGRADVAGIMPAVALELAGGDVPLSPKHRQCNLTVSVWSSASWAEAFQLQQLVDGALNLKSFVDGLPSPLLYCEGQPPQQLAEGDYYHLQQSFTVIAKEA